MVRGGVRQEAHRATHAANPWGSPAINRYVDSQALVMQAHAMRKVSNCPDHSLAKRSRAAPQGDNPLLSFIPPQLALLRREAPSGSQRVHEIKLDGYRIHARVDRGRVQLLTRNGLDWTERYRAKEQSLGKLPVDRAYLDGELCAVRPDGTTSFAAMQAATDSGRSGELMFFLFDLLQLDGADMRPRPLLERKARLEWLLQGVGDRLV